MKEEVGTSELPDPVPAPENGSWEEGDAALGGMMAASKVGPTKGPDLKRFLAELDVLVSEKHRKSFRALVRDFEREQQLLQVQHEELFQENEKLKLEVTLQREKRLKLKETLRSTWDHFRSSFSTFEKYRQALENLQQMRALRELPDVLGKLSSLLNISELGLVLGREGFSEFLPETVNTMSYQDIARGLKGVLSATGERGLYMGPVEAISNPDWFWGSGFTARHGGKPSGSCLIYPLRNKYHMNLAIGTISFYDQDPERYSQDKATDFLEHFCDVLSSDILNVRDHERLHRETILDELTGIHNRAYLARHMPRMLEFANRKGFPITLLFIDLNGFKAINDTLGHDAGDIILVEASRRISEMVREYDMFARLGGDEFCIVLPDTSVSHASRFIVRIKEALNAIDVAKVCNQTTDLKVGAAIGIGRHRPGFSLDDLLKEADEAMYEDKKACKGAR